MARKVSVDSASQAVVQGFRPGGGTPYPNVYVGILGVEGFPDYEMTLSAQEANELGEILRQEAEFAVSPRAEEDDK